ncbi:hypothetical protein [Streptomyces sp. NPDC059649]|uniref:hypothetical protein n=1 Tax=Streptomyces sp. NPDC059649 TaxID=3346895 RepID=UPI0036C0985E
MYQACQDEDIQSYTPVPVPYRRADAENLVGQKLPAQWPEDRDYTLGAFRKDTGGPPIRRLPARPASSRYAGRLAGPARRGR